MSLLSKENGVSCRIWNETPALKFFLWITNIHQHYIATLLRLLTCLCTSENIRCFECERMKFTIFMTSRKISTPIVSQHYIATLLRLLTCLCTSENIRCFFECERMKSTIFMTSLITISTPDVMGVRRVFQGGKSGEISFVQLRN